MSRWAYNTEAPPPRAFEAVEGAAALIQAMTELGEERFLGSTDQVYGHEEPVEKPDNERWIVVRQFQESGGQVIDPAGLLKVKLHVLVNSPRGMQDTHRWHAAVHDRIQQALIEKIPPLEHSATTHGYRLLTEPTRAEYYADTDTYESFALYAINLERIAA